MTTESKATCIVLHSGELLEAGPESTNGVITDAGLIAWEWITAFRCWHEPTEQWMTIPLD